MLDYGGAVLQRGLYRSLATFRFQQYISSGLTVHVERSKVLIVENVNGVGVC